MEENRKGKMIEWVKKLLALANSNGFEGEKETAARKAEELMSMYEITMADLIEEADVKRFIGRIDFFGLGSSIKKWEIQLADSIGRAFNCKFVFRHHDSYKDETGKTVFGWSMSYVGTDKDMEISIWFHKYLRRSVIGQAKMEYPRNQVSRDSYCIGMSRRIGDRLQEMYAKQEEYMRTHGGESCLALVVAKKGAVDAEFKNQFPKLGRGISIGVGDREAYHNGRNAAEKVGLHIPISKAGATKKQIAV